MVFISAKSIERNILIIITRKDKLHRSNLFLQLVIPELVILCIPFERFSTDGHHKIWIDNH